MSVKSDVRTQQKTYPWDKVTYVGYEHNSLLKTCLYNDKQHTSYKTILDQI